MAVTSTMLPLGTKAPDFTLPDTVTGNTVSLSDYSDRAGLLVMFICNHCPYVKHVREELAGIGKDYAETGLGIDGFQSPDVDVEVVIDSPRSSPGETSGQRHTYFYGGNQ